jgi:hypothetical protein
MATKFSDLRDKMSEERRKGNKARADLRLLEMISKDLKTDSRS